MNISKANKGRIMSEEAKDKLSKAKTGMKYKILTCPHCGRSGSGNFRGYHFNNCKQYNESNSGKN